MTPEFESSWKDIQDKSSKVESSEKKEPLQEQKEQLNEKEKILEWINKIVDSNDFPSEDFLTKWFSDFWGKDHVKSEFEKILNTIDENDKREIQKLKRIKNPQSLENYIKNNLEKPTNVTPVRLDKEPNPHTEALNVEKEKNEVEKEKDEIEKDAIEVKNNNTEYAESIQNAILAQNQLITKRPDIKEKIREWSDLYNQSKAELEKNWIINNLQGKWASQEEINNVISVYTTHMLIQSDDSLKNDPSCSEEISLFEKAYINFKNSCNIPDTSPNSFSSKNISETMDRAFNKDIWNESLIKDYENNKENIDFDINLSKDASKFFKIFKDHISQEEINKKMSEKSENKAIIDKYNSIKEKQNTDNSYQLTDDEKNIVNAYQELYQNVLSELTKWYLEESCKTSLAKFKTMGPIIWLSNYMWWNLWANFESNLSNDYSIDNWKLKMSWSINWNPFTLYQNLNNDAPLETSSYITRTWDESSPNYNIHMNWESSQKINWIIPSQNKINDICSNNLNANLESILWESQNEKDFQSKVNENLYNSVLSQYQNREAVQYDIWKQILKNIWIKDHIQNLNSIIPWESIPKTINTQSDNTIYSHFKTLNHFYENASKSDGELFNKCNHALLNIFNQIILSWWNQQKINDIPNFNELPKIIQDFLKNENVRENTKKLLKWENLESWNCTIFDIFKSFEDSKIDWSWDDKMYNVHDFFNMIQWKRKNKQDTWDKFQKITEFMDKENAKKFIKYFI